MRQAARSHSEEAGYAQLEPAAHVLRLEASSQNGGLPTPSHPEGGNLVGGYMKTINYSTSEIGHIFVVEIFWYGTCRPKNLLHKYYSTTSVTIRTVTLVRNLFYTKTLSTKI